MADRLPRRRLLGLLGSSSLVGLAGCTGGPSPLADGSTSHPVEPLELAVTATRSITAAHPGGLTLALRNHGDAPVTLLYRRGIEAPFSGIRGHRVDGDAPVALFPVERSVYRAVPCRGGADGPVPATRSDGCWTVDCEVTTPYDAVGLHELAPDGQFETAYAVLAPSPTPCVPAGRYRLTETVPAAVGGGLSMSEPTYPDTLTQRVRKRLTFEVDADGTLTATAELIAPDGATG